MGSIFFIFITELIAYRWGTAKLAAIGVSHDAHGHEVGTLAAHGPEAPEERSTSPKLIEEEAIESDTKYGKEEKSDVEVAVGEHFVDSAATQIIGVAILEFGVLLHRYISSCLPVHKSSTLTTIYLACSSG